MGILIYDGKCGFCTDSAKWARKRLPSPHHIAASQEFSDAGLADMGLTRADVERAAWWFEPGEDPAEGAECVARTLMAIGGIPAVVGRSLRLPGVRLLSDRAYRWVADNRPRVSRWVARLSDRSRRGA